MVILDTVIFAQKGHYLQGANPLREIDFKKTVSLRASTCSTRREYDRQGWRKCRFCRSIKPTVPVPKALASLMEQTLGLSPASMLATVVQAATRMQTCLFASLETERGKVYG